MSAYDPIYPLRLPGEKRDWKRMAKIVEEIKLLASERELPVILGAQTVEEPAIAPSRVVKFRVLKNRKRDPQPLRLKIDWDNGRRP